MSTLSATIRASIAALFQSQLDLGSVDQNVRRNVSAVLTNGTGANQANQMWADTRTLAASATEELDLAGVLTDAFGATITFTKIKAIMLEAASGNANDVLVGGAAANGFIAMFGDATDIIKVKPGGFMVNVAPDANGFAVAAGTADKLKIANSAGGTSVTYTITLIGVV